MTGTSAGRKSTAKKVGAASAAEQTGATTVVAKKTPGTATAAKTAVPKARLAAVEPGELAVRPGEEPWTPQEVEEARAELQSEQGRLRAELASSEAALTGLMRDSGDGAGDDQADTGTKNITREHELALAANAREMLIQTEHALERLDSRHVRPVRELRPGHRQGPDAGLPEGHAVRRVQAEAGAPVLITWRSGGVPYPRPQSGT